MLQLESYIQKEMDSNMTEKLFREVTEEMELLKSWRYLVIDGRAKIKQTSQRERNRILYEPSLRV
ncbi:hypothetical protein BOTNAR_0048g00300 [Botryotinia narcissicola]|uniref:Uncharacterized protein n=1 Tax=Botryotinia narcissicola TaxID=278944 RepID=A0A4Z1J0G2_9HELO|nr:hypothetical protein BOTNAR_0048g00300 [Botryotinia narcissicola]